MVRQAESLVDIELKRRNDLIPELVRVVEAEAHWQVIAGQQTHETWPSCHRRGVSGKRGATARILDLLSGIEARNRTPQLLERLTNHADCLDSLKFPHHPQPQSGWWFCR